MGNLLSPNYHSEPVTLTDVKLTTFVFGFTLGFASLTTWKAVHQTMKIWKRTNSVTVVYTWMIWIELIVNLVVSVISWLFMEGKISPSFAFFFGLLILWVFQVQLLLQIIINRLSLIMMNQRRAKQIKWGVAGVILLVNISVFCIWIPARLQISEKFIHINEIWDRIEKIIYLLVDASLNCYFIYLVHARLISQGLNKYKPLLRFNVAMVVISLSMDASHILLICMLGLSNSLAYVQFHPLAFLVKLYIEMFMAELITKIVKRSQRADHSSSPHGTDLQSRPKHTVITTHTSTKKPSTIDEENSSYMCYAEGGDQVDKPPTSTGSRDDEVTLGSDGAIWKTTNVTTKWIDGDD